MESNVKERSITEELLEVLKKKKVDFLTFSQALSTGLKKRLELAKKPTAAQIEKALLPYLGGVLMMRGKYLALKQTDEELLLCVLRKSNWKIPRMDLVPFKKDEFFNVLNRLLEKSIVRVQKIDKEKKVLLLAPGEETLKPSQQPPRAEPTEKAFKAAELEPLPIGKTVSEEAFKAAFQELERGKFYARICDMRRHLGWSAQEFDSMLTGLRNAGKIQLQTGDTDFFSEEEIRDSFRDENGSRKLTMMWRQ